MEPTPRWGIPRKDNPAGGVTTRVADLVEFMAMHLRGGIGTNGTRILSESSAQDMRKSHVVPAEGRPLGKLSGQGLGWHLSDWAGAEMFGHDGGTFGQYSHSFALPAYGLLVSVVVAGGDPLALFDAIDREVKKALDITQTTDTNDVPEGLVVNPAVIGVYEREGMVCRIFEEDGLLKFGATMRGTLHEVLQQGSEEHIVELTLLASDRMAYGEGPSRKVIEFIRTPRGNEFIWTDVAIPRASS